MNYQYNLCQQLSDAIDKIRYKSITDSDSAGLNQESNFKIKIIPDKNNNTLTIQIGKNRDELNNNIDTIAKSGTKVLMEAINSEVDISMIGQFGVGFYSTYLIADKVIVLLKAVGQVQLRLESQLLFFILNKIIQRLKDLIKKHLEFIGFPISLSVEKLMRRKSRRLKKGKPKKRQKEKQDQRSFH